MSSRALFLAAALLFILAVGIVVFSPDDTTTAPTSPSDGEPLTRTDSGPYFDRQHFELAPFESLEYKYRLADNQAVIYRWRASAPVTFDFHGDPEPEGQDRSYAAGEGDTDGGHFHAPFAGVHGWFWENRGSETLSIELQAATVAGESVLYRDGHVTTQPLSCDQQAD